MSDPKFEIYEDASGEWRWRLRATNGKIIATSGEGYVKKQHCVDARSLVRSALRESILIEDDGN